MFRITKRYNTETIGENSNGQTVFRANVGGVEYRHWCNRGYTAQLVQHYNNGGGGRWGYELMWLVDDHGYTAEPFSGQAVMVVA